MPAWCNGRRSTMTSSGDVLGKSAAGGLIDRAAPSGRAEISHWPEWQTVLLTALLIAVLAALVLPPFVFLLKASIVVGDSQRGEWGLGNFATVVGNRHFVATSVNSLMFAAGSAVVALAIGWATAWIVERTNTPLKPLAYLTAIISLGTPYILYVSAWLLVFGKAGPVNQLYRYLSGTTDILINVYSMSGMIMVEGFLWSPLAFLLAGATLRNVNPELEEAARMSGAGLWATIRRVTLRMSLPSILALSMLVFIRAVEAFEVPALVGLPGRISVLTTDIYGDMVAKAPPDIGAASALSVLMLGLVLVLLYVYGRLSRHAERYATITGKGFRARPFDLGRLRLAAALLLLLNFLLLLLVPMAMLLWVSLLPFYQPVSPAALKLVTLSNYRIVLDPDHLGLIANTLLVAVATATDRDGADLRGGLADGAAPAGRLDRRPARDHSAGLSRPRSGHRGDATVPASTDPALRHGWHPDLGVRDQLPALWHALQRIRHAANPSRARGIRGNMRCLAVRPAAPDRGAAARSGAAGGLVIHLPDGGARAVAGDPARRSAFADHGGDTVRPVGQRAGHRACGARVDMVHADGDDRGDLLRPGTPLCGRSAGPHVNHSTTSVKTRRRL